MIRWKKIRTGYFRLTVPDQKEQFIVRTLPFNVYSVPYGASNLILSRFISNLSSPNTEKSGYKSYFAVDFVLTTLCNFRCTYCCALSENSDRYYDLPPKHMDKTTAQNTINMTLRLFEDELKKDRRSRSATFDVFITGGEPLLNIPVLKFIISQYDKKMKLLCRKYRKNITASFEVATNGSLITDKIADFFRIHNVQCAITVDGPDHDRQRPYRSGGGSLRDVLGGLRILIDHGNKIKLQTVALVGNAAYIKKTADFYNSYGLLDKIKRVHIIPRAQSIRDRYLKRVEGMPYDSAAYKKFSSTLMEISQQYKLDMKNYQGRLLRSIGIGGLPYRCPAGQWKIAVAPDGGIFPCHQLTNIPEFSMGNVRDKPELLNRKLGKIRKIFQKRTVFRVTPCKDCLFQTICIPFVDCPARSFLETGDLYTVKRQYCQIHLPYMEKILTEFLMNITGKVNAPNGYLTSE